GAGQLLLPGRLSGIFSPGMRVASILPPLGEGWGGGFSGRLVEAARIELASEAASRKTSTSVVPVLHLTGPAPVGQDPHRPVAVLSPPGGRDARRERVSGVYAG